MKIDNRHDQKGITESRDRRNFNSARTLFVICTRVTALHSCSANQKHVILTCIYIITYGKTLSLLWELVRLTRPLQKLIWQNLKKVFHLLHLQFVSHPYSQLVLNSEIYRDVPFLEKSSWKQFILILLAFVWYPLFFMVWLVLDTFFPKHEVSRMFHSPCVKFLVHCGSYQTFLFMLFLSSFKFQSDFLQYAIAGK